MISERDVQRVIEQADQGWSIEYDGSLPWLNAYIDDIRAVRGLGKVRADATWINVMKGRGTEIPEHTEGRADDDVTVVLFLTSHEEDAGGQLIVDGREPVTPKKGEYVVFPSKTKHRVTALLTDEPRVSVGVLTEGVARA